MAEVAILEALKLLGEALATKFVKQATSQASETFSAISTLEVRMNNLSSELRVMQAFLDQIDMHNESNKTLVAWLGEVQTVANRIKDIMDEFMYLISKQKFGGMGYYIKSIFKEPKSLIELKQIATRLEGAEMSIIRVGEIKDRWLSTNDTITRTGDANESAVQVAISSHFIDEQEIIGIDLEKRKLASLINSNDPSCSIISVWGMAGIGKTTLVTNAFKRERKHFTCYAWICLSQTYKAYQVLRNLVSEICKNDHTNPINANDMDMRELKETIRSLLQHRKYLIVLDDVWDQNSILDIRDVFVEYLLGSRIIITSRMADVASLARESNRLELNPLPIKDAWNLFRRKTFQFERNHECPPHLYKWAKQIVSKCDGLPLAIVSLSSVLSSCAKNEYEWKRINDQLVWEMENNKSLDRLRSIVKLSFDYLPKYLKNCFLYCCMFPEDYLHARRKLIRLWIAEGFVEQKGECTLEETAESYLFELINRSMLQVARKNYFGRVKRCRMHDTLRELAISLCLKEKFCFLYGEHNMNIDKSARRLSIIKFGNKIGHHVQLPLLRTLMSFDLSMHSFELITTGILKCRYLAVLNLQDLSIKSLPESIGDLFNLHYLGMRNTKVKVLPNSIDKLHNLQTLDLCNSEIQEIPDGIVQLTQLRHLFAEVEIDNTYKSLRTRTGIKLPKDMFYLKEIQTIKAVESNAMVVRELSNLTQMRSIRIWDVKENHSAELCKSLSKLNFLSYLSINASNENEILHLEGLDLPNILKLSLRGRLRESMLKSPLFQTSFQGIQTLRLGWSQLQNDPLPSLSHLRNLTFLYLNRAYEGQQLIFQAGWFSELKCLVIRQMHNLVNVEMEQGTMESLEQIEFGELKQLMEIPKGMKYLISLKSMFCTDMPSNFGGLAKGTKQILHFTCISNSSGS